MNLRKFSTAAKVIAVSVAAGLGALGATGAQAAAIFNASVSIDSITFTPLSGIQVTPGIVTLTTGISNPPPGTVTLDLAENFATRTLTTTNGSSISTLGSWGVGNTATTTSVSGAMVPTTAAVADTAVGTADVVGAWEILNTGAAAQTVSAVATISWTAQGTVDRPDLGEYAAGAVSVILDNGVDTTDPNYVILVDFFSLFDATGLLSGGGTPIPGDTGTLAFAFDFLVGVGQTFNLIATVGADAQAGSFVPEPGSLALLGIGLAGLAALRRRRGIAGMV